MFTSLSKSLCEEQVKVFTQMVNKVNAISYKENNNINNNNHINRRGRIIDEIYSFRDIYSYPAFINFRKIMFLIDGSLTFQFF